MTTAARPTFEPARGGSGKGEKDLSALSRQYSSRDLPGQTKLKFREPGQGTIDEIKGKDYRRELEERERQVRRDKDKELVRSRPPTEDLALSAAAAAAIQQPPSKRSRTDHTNLDADEPAADSSEDDDDDDDEDEDDTAALMAELQRIKKERALEAAKKDVEKKAEEERIRAENILSGNPLLNQGHSSAVAKSDMKVKRRWDEDVVFKNCARVDESKKDKAFINDTLRSDFHKKFMEKYIK